MKKCRQCANQSTLHITEVIEGQASEIHLCEKCARDYLDDSESHESDSIAADLAAKLEELHVATDGELDQLTCSGCGIKMSEFRELGRLGCPFCYDEFREHLRPLLENIHEEPTHSGKRPSRTSASLDDQSRVLQLRNRQREAIRQEDYESAATLRDEITELEALLRGEEITTPDED
ncbi:MAG: UvrB/UvrC motif-containing protein [Fuerstiella sp.]|nr:UvrB/UvrC motif-containing protein [Fuerstiella sp.]